MAFFDQIFGKRRGSRIYSVMNEDHAELYKIVGRLRSAAGQRCRTHEALAGQHEQCQALIKELVADTVKHFEREEGLMRRYDYPLTRQHAMEHRVLLRTIETFELGLRERGGTITPDDIAYIKDWLTRHIGNADRHLENFLAGCTEKRTEKRGKDMSGGGSHPLSFLFSVNDATPPDAAAVNRSFRAQYDAGLAERSDAWKNDQRSRLSANEQKRQQDSIWYD